MHNKTPNALLFNSGAKILCSVKCVRKPDAQTHSIMLHLPPTPDKGKFVISGIGGVVIRLKTKTTIIKKIDIIYIIISKPSNTGWPR